MNIPSGTKVYALDIRNAELEGLIRLFTNWNAERRGEHAQDQWRAIVGRLINDELMTAFCNETGIGSSNLTGWESGDKLPSEQMCAMYINLLIRKIEEELSQIAEKRQQLIAKRRKSVAKKSEGEAHPLPEREILSFELPESIPPETAINTLKGFSDLPGRVRNCLRDDGIVIAETLAKPRKLTTGKTWQWATLSIPNFGPVSLSPLYHFMINNGFKPTLAA